jgi:hypothetical protein
LGRAGRFFADYWDHAPDRRPTNVRRFNPNSALHAELVALGAVVAVATVSRVWQFAALYRQSARLAQERRRRDGERALFARLERCMKSDRVDGPRL